MIKIKTINVEIIQKIETKMLDVFSETCEKNNLTYFLSDGTLLGAVRDAKFIPWDTDIDIEVPIRDYLKVYNFFPHNETSFQLLNYNYNSQYDKSFMRLSMSNKFHYNVHVDIVPLIGVPSTLKKQKKLYRKINILHFIYSRRKRKVLDNKGIMKKTFFAILKIATIFITQKRVRKSINNLFIKYSFENSEFLMNPMADTFDKSVRPKKWYDIKETMMFNGKDYVVPKKHHEILTLLYNDYNVFPEDSDKFPRNIQIKDKEFEILERIIDLYDL